MEIERRRSRIAMTSIQRIGMPSNTLCTNPTIPRAASVLKLRLTPKKRAKVTTAVNREYELYCCHRLSFFNVRQSTILAKNRPDKPTRPTVPCITPVKDTGMQPGSQEKNSPWDAQAKPETATRAGPTMEPRLPLIPRCSPKANPTIKRPNDATAAFHTAA